MAEEDELIDQAARLLKKKDKKAARSLLRKAVKIDPKNERAWTLLADATDAPEESKKHLQTAKEMADLQKEIRTLKSGSRKPLIIWNKTTRLWAGLLFITFTLLPFLWNVFTDIIPAMRAVNRMTGEWNVAVAGFTDLDTDLQRSFDPIHWRRYFLISKV